MNNVHQSANAIALGLRAGQKPTEIAEFLQELNLLAPDLPEPSPGTDGALIWHNGEVWLEDNDTDVYTDLHSPFDWMTTDQARELAYALLAAANHQEKA